MELTGCAKENGVAVGEVKQPVSEKVDMKNESLVKTELPDKTAETY